VQDVPTPRGAGNPWLDNGPGYGEMDPDTLLHQLMTVQTRDLDLSAIKHAARPAGAATALVFSKDGKTLTSGGRDKTIRLWDPAGRKVRHEIAVDMWQIESLAFSPNERLLVAVGGGGYTGSIMLFDAATRKEVAAVPDLKEAVNCAAFSPDGSLLATGHKGGQVTVWAVGGKGLKKVVELKEGREGMNAFAGPVAFIQGGRTLVIGGGKSIFDGSLQFVDIKTSAIRETTRLPMGVESIAVSGDGKAMAVGTSTGIDRKRVVDTPGRLMIGAVNP